MVHKEGFSKNPRGVTHCIKFSVLISSVAGWNTQNFNKKNYLGTQFVKISIRDVLIKLVSSCQRFADGQKFIP